MIGKLIRIEAGKGLHVLRPANSDVFAAELTNAHRLGRPMLILAMEAVTEGSAPLVGIQADVTKPFTYNGTTIGGVLASVTGGKLSASVAYDQPAASAVLSTLDPIYAIEVPADSKF